MSYKINLTNNTTLTTVLDGQIDTTSTDLALVGKNATGYGLYMNDNFVHLLENFANYIEPPNPIQGQLWYDTSVNLLKVYNGRSFVTTTGTYVSSSVPSGLTTGELWINSETGQLYFNDGVETILAGPVYNKTQGTSGFVTDTVLDTNQLQHVIVLLYVNETLLGIFSKDEFTPASEIAGFSGVISPGFNVGSFPGVTFNVNAASASALLAADGSSATAESFLSSTADSSTSGTISIQNDLPLILGNTSSTEIISTSSLFNIKSNSINQDLEISTLTTGGQQTALYVDGMNSRVGVFTNTPQYTLDINGTVLIEGNLIVNGTTTSTNTSTIDLADLTITLADTPSPTDVTANGAGLIVRGSTDHSFLWKTGTGWTSSEGLNVTSGNSYSVGGVSVLSGTTLGSSVVNIDGTLTGLKVNGTVSLNNLALTGNQIGYVNSAYVNGDISLVPKGTGSVNVNSAKIINLATPGISDVGTTAANKMYVDYSIQASPLAASLTVTGLTNTQIAGAYLSRMFPSSEHRDNSVCRVACTDMANNGGTTAGPGAAPANPLVTGRLYSILSVGTTDFTQIGASSNTVGTLFVATGTGTGTGTANPVIRVFTLLSGVWTYQSNL